jgi:hypothetical protein
VGLATRARTTRITAIGSETVVSGEDAAALIGV